MSDQDEQHFSQDVPWSVDDFAKKPASNDGALLLGAQSISWALGLFMFGLLSYLFLSVAFIHRPSFEQQMATDAVRQFNIVLKSKDPHAIASQASVCADMFLRAGDEANYLQFKKISDDYSEIAAKKVAREIFGR